MADGRGQSYRSKSRERFEYGLESFRCEGVVLHLVRDDRDYSNNLTAGVAELYDTACPR